MCEYVKRNFIPRSLCWTVLTNDNVLIASIYRLVTVEILSGPWYDAPFIQNIDWYALVPMYDIYELYSLLNNTRNDIVLFSL